MKIKLFALLSICLTALPAWAEDNSDTGGWEPPPPALVEGWDQEVPPAKVEGWDTPDLETVSIGIRQTPEISPSCGDGLINGEEVCDPTAFRGFLSNLCKADCELSVPQGQYDCVMDSFSDCNTQAREKLSAEMKKVKENGEPNEEVLENLREQFSLEQKECYESAYVGCLPEVDNTNEVSIEEPHPEISEPEAPLIGLSGSGCMMSAGASVSFPWGLAWGFAFLMSGMGFLRTRS